MMKKIIIGMFGAMIVSSCGIENVLDCYNGEDTKKEIQVEKFTSLDVDIPCHIELMNGDVQKTIVEGKEDMIRDLEKRSIVVNGEWRLRLRDNCIIRSSEVKITMIVPGLKEIDIDGNGKIFSREKLSNLNKSFLIEVDGNADTDLVMDVEELSMNVDGNAKLELNGKANKMSINVDGNSTLNCHNFVVKSMNLKIDGNSTANVHCTEVLDVDIDGSGKVCYKGNPNIISRIDGVGKVINCN